MNFRWPQLRQTLCGTALLWGLCGLTPWTASAQIIPPEAPNVGSPVDEVFVSTQKLARSRRNAPFVTAAYGQMALALLQQHPNHALRAYWVHSLAYSAQPAGGVLSALSAEDPLRAHFYWWRAMRQNPKTPAGQAACRRDFAAYADTLQHLPTGTPLPQVPESTVLQAQLPCVVDLPESQRLAIARVIQEHHYFWLLPRVLHHVKTPQALLWQGENRMLLRQYAAAAIAFEQLIQHPGASGEQKKQAVIQAGLAEKSRQRMTQARQWWAWISPQDNRFYPEVLWHEGQWDTLIQRYPNHERVADILAERLDKAVIAQNQGQIQALGRQLLRYFARHEAAHQARYWLARSLERQGKTREAREWYQQQAGQALNNYYTQMARCRLNQDNYFALPRQPLTSVSPNLAFLQREPILQQLVRQKNHEVLEVVAPFVALNPLERDLLMAYAYRYNGHYFRSIRSIWRQQTRDPEILRLMYPLHYDALQKENASRFGVPQALIAGITWQESMYKADIRSVSGARGLMQLMPRTATYIAAKAGLPGLSLWQLDHPPVNIRLGTYYLQQQSRRTGGNLMKIAASYNGGPNAVARWAQAFGKIEDDVFVERIPYAETRRYAKQVTMHTRLYSQLYGE